ncbi:MAG: T9SS type A sorting domain-containing protein [Flavobacterium sp.]|nr:MAG: T9SS type A sorting domain-containing protein [Flavobacterium sp.]
MKKTLLFLLSVGFAQVSFGQTFFTDSFSTYTIGNVGTDITGATPGQGSYLTTSTNGTDPTTTTNSDNSNFQIFDAGGANGQVLQLTGPNGDKGSRFMWQTGLPAMWASRTVGNNILEVEYDFYTGDPTTSVNTMRMYIYDSPPTTTSKILAGFTFAMNTKILTGVAYYDNTATAGGIVANYGFQMGLLGTTAANLTLAPNTWVRIGMSFNYATGQVKWKGPGFNPNAQLTGAAAGVNPETLYLVSSSGTNTAATPPVTNTSSAVARFDNIVMRATNTDTLLGVAHVSPMAEFSAYPNPVQDVLNVTNNAGMGAYEMADLNGRTVKAGTLGNATDATLDISELASGIYMLNIASDAGKITKKIVKQ